MRFSHFITACALTFIGAQAMAFNAVEGKDYRVVSPSVSSPSDSIEVIDFSLTLVLIASAWHRCLKTG